MLKKCFMKSTKPKNIIYSKYKKNYYLLNQDSLQDIFTG